MLPSKRFILGELEHVPQQWIESRIYILQCSFLTARERAPPLDLADAQDSLLAEIDISNMRSENFYISVANETRSIP